MGLPRTSCLAGGAIGVAVIMVAGRTRDCSHSRGRMAARGVLFGRCDWRRAVRAGRIENGSGWTKAECMTIVRFDGCAGQNEVAADEIQYNLSRESRIKKGRVEVEDMCGVYIKTLSRRSIEYAAYAAYAALI